MFHNKILSLSGIDILLIHGHYWNFEDSIFSRAPKRERKTKSGISIANTELVMNVHAFAYLHVLAVFALTAHTDIVHAVYWNETQNSYRVNIWQHVCCDCYKQYCSFSRYDYHLNFPCIFFSNQYYYHNVTILKHISPAFSSPNYHQLNYSGLIQLCRPQWYILYLVW